MDAGVIISGDYTAKGVLLNRQTLYPALKQAILAIGALSVQVDTAGMPKTTGKFVRLPTVLLDDVVTFVQAKRPLDELLMDEFTRGFEFGTSTPLWRLTVVSGKTVLFHYDHSIGDGQSGLAFHIALLSALNNPSIDVGTSADTVTIPITPSLVPAVETLTNTSPSLGLWARAIYGTFTPSSWQSSRFIWTGNPIVQEPTLELTARSWQIPAEQAKKLVVLCRQHETTLTGFLRTLIAIVLANLLQQQPAASLKPYTKIATQVPVSLRRFTGASPYVMCDQSSAVGATLRIASAPRLSDPDTPFPWATAAQFNRKMRVGVEKESRQIVGLLGFLVRFGIMEQWFTGSLGKKRECTLEFSNLGRFPPPPPPAADAMDAGEPAWSLGNVYFAQSDPVKGSAVKTSIVGSPDGSVNIVYTWGKGAIDDELAEALVRDVTVAFSRVMVSESSSP